MSYLKKELERMIKYAEGLGVKVIFSPARRNSPSAEWTTDGSEITLYTTKRKTTTQYILDLLHELSHHIAWTYKGRKTAIRTDDALLAEFQRKKNDPPIPKSKRKIIYDDEKHDSQYQELIFNELGLKIPKWKMEVDRDLSNWIYFRFYQTGEYPGRKETKLKLQQLKNKYK